MQANAHHTRTKRRAGDRSCRGRVGGRDRDRRPGDGVVSPRAASTARPNDPCEPWGNGKKVAIATAKLIVEYNATDQDIGVHGAFDDQGWSKLCVYDPDGDLVLRASPESQLKDLTIAGIFFESREPPIDEFSFEDLKARFPEGRYNVRALGFDGTRLVGNATFTHDVPAAPTVTAPSDGAEVDPDDLTVRWKDVTETVDGAPVTITGYEVIITKEQHVDPHGFSQPIYDVHVPPTATRCPCRTSSSSRAPSTSSRSWRSRGAATRPSASASSRPSSRTTLGRGRRGPLPSNSAWQGRQTYAFRHSEWRLNNATHVNRNRKRSHFWESKSDPVGEREPAYPPNLGAVRRSSFHHLGARVSNA